MKRNLLYIVLAGFLWGSSGIFSNLLSPYGFSPLQLTAVRGIVSGLCMVISLLIFGRGYFRVRKNQILFCLAAGAAVFCTAASYYTAIRASSVSTAVVLMYTSPAFITGYSVLFLGEKITKGKALSIAAMILGCMLVSGIFTGMTFSPWGIFWGLAAAICYSVYSILAKIEVMRGVHANTASLYHFTTMGFIGLFFLDPSSTAASVAKNPAVVIPLLIGIGICTCVLPYFLFSLSLRTLSVGTASALEILEPLSATLYSVIFFREKLTLSSIGGIVLILGACLILSRMELKERK